MALTKIKTGGLADNAVTDAKVADAITVTAATISGSTLASGVTASSLTSVGTLTGLTIANNNQILGAADGVAYSFTGDPDTGVQSGGTNTIQITTGGSKAMDFDGNQLATFAGDVNVQSDGARFFVKSADEELVSIGRAGSSGDALDQGYIRMKSAGINKIAFHSASNSYITGGLSIGTSSMNSNATVHIRGGDSGQSSSSNNTQLTVESSGTAGIQLLTGTTNVGGFWIGDSNGAETGGKLYYSNNDDSWSFYNSGSNNTLNIKSAGLVGINCSPANGYPLEVLATSGNANVRVSATGSGQGARLFLRSHNTDSTYLSFNDSDDDTVLAQIRSYGTAHSSTAKRRGLALETAGSERVFIKSDGYVGINEGNPGFPLHISFDGEVAFAGDTDLNGESVIYLQGTSADNEAVMIRWANHGSMNNYFGVHQVGASGPGDFVWTGYDGSSYNERLRLKANGNLIAKQLNQTGTTSNRYPLYWVYTGTDGSIEPYTGSVRAMKKDIADMGSVDWINSLRPRSFKFRDFEDIDGVRTYKDTTNDNPITEYGLIAEEVDEVEGSDYIVDKNSDGEIKGVLYHNLVPILLKALQEQNERIKALEGN